MLILKVYNISPKKYRGVMSNDTAEWCRRKVKKFEEKLTFGWKNDMKIWKKVVGALELFKINTLIGSCSLNEKTKRAKKLLRGYV